MASRFVAVKNKEISQIIRKDVFEKHEQGDEINFFTGTALSVQSKSVYR